VVLTRNLSFCLGWPQCILRWQILLVCAHIFLLLDNILHQNAIYFPLDQNFFSWTIYCNTSFLHGHAVKCCDVKTHFLLVAQSDIEHSQCETVGLSHHTLLILDTLENFLTHNWDWFPHFLKRVELDPLKRPWYRISCRIEMYYRCEEAVYDISTW
jgi:hypothetical protein